MNRGRYNILPTDKCTWCHKPGAYKDGTGCVHGQPPVDCKEHGRLTDLNLVARGRRAVVKCAHYGNACVVLYADPIGDDKEHGSYTVVFIIQRGDGVGGERYTIPPQSHQCPHEIFDTLVREMRGGVRPHPSRVPDPSTRTAKPGEELRHGE